MTSPQDRLSSLHQRHPALRLYALVDGAQYATHRGQPLAIGSGHCALFDGTPDAPLAHAGPWLLDAERIGQTLVQDLMRLEQAAPAVTWLMAFADLRGLAQVLRIHLDVRLPDGRNALLRFWDPRVLATLAQTLDSVQREAFFSHIHEWHLLLEGRRVWIGRQDADAH